MTHIDPEYQRLLAAWQKAQMIKNVDPSDHRMDRSNRVMSWLDYGNASSEYGWVLAPLDQSAKPDQFDMFEATHIKTAEEIADGANRAA